MAAEYFSISEAMKYLKEKYNEDYHYSTFPRWIKEGKIKAFRRGGQWRVFKDSLDNFFCSES